MDSSFLSEKQRRCIPNVSFELIPIKNLVSNQDYQRPLSEKQIRSTAEEFDVYQINPVKVSRRDGINYVFDGQHTIEIVALESGSRETPVWCMIYNELDYQSEAHIFSEQQTHVRGLLPYEMYNAHIEAGDEKQKMIEKIVNSYNLIVTKGSQPNGICAVSTLERIFDKYGADTLDRALKLAVSTWEGENYSLSGSVLMGIARIIVAYKESLSDDMFVDHLSKVSVKSIIRTAKERRPGALGYAEAMMLAYNNKNKYRLSLRTLYGGKAVLMADDEEEDEDI